MSPEKPASRHWGLDVLRGLAVLLVLGHHRYYWHLWAKMGWAGVQLFFVLSGFLISGLLFREYRLTGGIDVRRFLIRRGFKIYPTFYVFVLLTVLFQQREGAHFTGAQIGSELFFLQSYLKGVWQHTWSLAVEEHFYLLLPVSLFFMLRRAKDESSAFARLPIVLLWIIGLSLVARSLTVLASRPITLETHLIPTHLNLDGLATGVLVSYYYHFHFSRFMETVKRYRSGLFLALGVGFASALVLWREDPLMVAVGISVINVSFCALLVLTLGTKLNLHGFPSWIGRCLGGAVAYVGVHSYAIYLWHMAVNQWGTVKVRLILHQQPSSGFDFVVYLVGSVVMGVVLTRLVEWPSLWVRDRFWPSRSSRSGIEVPERSARESTSPAIVGAPK